MYRWQQVFAVRTFCRLRLALRSAADAAQIVAILPFAAFGRLACTLTPGEGDEAVHAFYADLLLPSRDATSRDSTTFRS